MMCTTSTTPICVNKVQLRDIEDHLLSTPYMPADQNLDDCVYYYEKRPTRHFSQTIGMPENNWYSSPASQKYTVKATNPIMVSNMNISTATPYQAPRDGTYVPISFSVPLNRQQIRWGSVHQVLRARDSTSVFTSPLVSLARRVSVNQTLCQDCHPGKIGHVAE